MRAWVCISKGWLEKMRHTFPSTPFSLPKCLYPIYLSISLTLNKILIQECKMWFIAMQRRWSATAANKWSRYNEFQNNHINQRNRIWVQVRMRRLSVLWFFPLSFLDWVDNSFFLRVYLHRTTSGPAITRDYTEDGLVRDGTPCGKNLVCVNQTCVSIFPYIDQTKCPTDGNNVECYGQGVSQNRFYIFTLLQQASKLIEPKFSSFSLAIVPRVLGVHKYESLLLWYRLCWSRLCYCCAGNNSGTNRTASHCRQYH